MFHVIALLLLAVVFRGCGCMTAKEQVINGADVPFCKR
jgi:hypothetical protein